jgi:hypothetical protein
LLTDSPEEAPDAISARYTAPFRPGGRLAIAQPVDEVEYATGQGRLETVNVQARVRVRQIAEVNPELVICSNACR